MLPFLLSSVLTQSCCINDIQYSIYMVVTTALPLYRIIIILYWISLMLLAWMRLMALVLMMSVLAFMTMMMILSMILVTIVTMILMMILMMVGAGTEDHSHEKPNSYLR